MSRMSVSDLKSMLASEKADALAGISAARLMEERADAMDYYLGDMRKDMPAQDGRSRAVSTDVADIIEGLMPSLMDIFAGSDEVVRFEPVGPEDEAAAQQETDYVNHVFMQQNPGFMVLYSFIKDALLSKVGIVKVWWEEREEESRETYYDLTDDQFALLAQAVMESGGVMKIVAHTVLGAGDLPENPAPPISPASPITHDVTIISTRKLAQARVLGVPPEEFGIERGARSIRDCNYCFHEVVTKTEGQLIAEGFDREQIKSLGETAGNTDAEMLSRDTVGESLNTGAGDANSATRLVRITEHYVRMDYEGNGRPCLYQVVTGGDQSEILRKDGRECITPFDTIPFATTTPVPMTHRFFGRSIADLVMPLQREKTALKRGALDNLYLHNNPRVEVAESNAGPNTLDDLLVSRPGGVVRTRTAGGLNWQVVPDITTSIYPMLRYIDAELETRSGLARQSQGIDANALQNQSATAVAQVFSASQMRIKLIARIMAEGVRDIFALLHGTIRKHGQIRETVRLRNAWVDVDPRGWKTRDDMTINVGLGAGGKAQQFAQVMALANIQKQLVAGGKAHLVGDRELYNTAAELTKIMGHKNPDRFFCDPTAIDPQTGQLLNPPRLPPPPPPDPKLLALQAKAQADQAAAAHKSQFEQQRAQNDAIHQQVKTQAEIELAKIKAELNAKMAVLDAHLKAAVETQKMQRCNPPSSREAGDDHH
ncbi:hypothetical protein [Bradyrhizobium sp.]|uniref:portal protein n=1 Tax=Bradyrhizobium sp. TaxID=376 RepID=UPI002732D984|nr:hypothetical protein [Bradyrhizobium sp.]MDP3076635.1 hypothetical protein [Bradyrhizobium sp.]